MHILAKAWIHNHTHHDTHANNGQTGHVHPQLEGPQQIMNVMDPPKSWACPENHWHTNTPIMATQIMDIQKIVGTRPHQGHTNHGHTCKKKWTYEPTSREHKNGHTSPQVVNTITPAEKSWSDTQKLTRRHADHDTNQDTNNGTTHTT